MVAADLTEGDGPWSVTVGLLHTSSSRGGLASGLGSELLTRGLSSGGLAGGLLGTGHFVVDVDISMCVRKWNFVSRTKQEAARRRGRAESLLVSWDRGRADATREVNILKDFTLEINIVYIYITVYQIFIC